jgi:hypothetical protein
VSEIPDPVPDASLGENFGTVAYRIIVLAALGVTLLAAKGTYDKLDKTVDALEVMGRSITALNGRLDAQADRLAAHDRRFERIEDRVFINPRPNP